jgi:hypothetical protein
LYAVLQTSKDGCPVDEKIELHKKVGTMKSVFRPLFNVTTLQ